MTNPPDDADPTQKVHPTPPPPQAVRLPEQQPFSPGRTVATEQVQGQPAQVAEPPTQQNPAPQSGAGHPLAGEPTALPASSTGSTRWTAQTTDARPRVPRDPAGRLTLIVLLLALVALGLSLLSVASATRLSALDEATHIDYAYRLSHGELAYSGEPLSTYTTNAWACRGQANIPNLPACGSNAPYSAFPGNGLQYNAFHPPIYYAVTGPAARALAALFGQDFITMARSLGGVWLFAGMLAMYLTLRYWRVEWTWAVGGTLLLPLFPTLLHASSIVTNDAPALLCGVAALFLLGRSLIYRNDGWALPVVIAGGVAATKGISATGLLAVAFMFFIIGIARWRRGNGRAAVALIRNSVLIGLAVGVVQLIWSAVQSGRAVAGYVSPVSGVNTRKVVGSPFDEWVSTVLDGARLGSNYYLDPAVNSPYLIGWVLLITSIIAATGLIGLALFRRGSPEWFAGATLVLGTLMYPLIVQVQAYVDGDFFPGITNRYGTTLIPLAVGVLTLIVALKKLRVTSGVILTLGSIAVVTATLGVQ